MKLAVCATLFAAIVSSACRAADKPHQSVRLHLESVHITQFSRQAIQAEVILSFEAPVGARITHIQFSHLQANGLPFFADAVEQEFATHGSEPVTLPPMQLHFYLPDMDSVSPLQRMVEDQTAHVTADVELTVKAGLLQALFLGEREPTITMHVDQDVHVQLPGGILSRALATTVLQGLEKTLRADPFSERDAPTELQEEAHTAAQSLARVTTCWHSAVGMGEPLCEDRIAFAGASGYFTSADAAEPWRFSSSAAAPKSAKDAQVQTTLHAANGSGDASVSRVGEPRARKLIVFPSRTTREVLDASSTDTYAIARPSAEMSAPPLPIAGAASGSSLHVAVFRFAKATAEGWSYKPVFTDATVFAGGVHFARPLPEAAMGSPIVGPTGVIGIVSSERGGTLLRTTAQ